MRNFLYYWASLCLILTLQGEVIACEEYGIRAYPSNGLLYENSWVLLEGIGRSQEIIANLNTKYPVWLVAADHKVRLIVKKRYEGMYNVNQVLLKPIGGLKGGKSYELQIDNMLEEDEGVLIHWDAATRSGKKFSWLVKGGCDRELPEWKNAPVYKGGSTKWLGDGAEVMASFSWKTKEEQNLWLHTECIDIKTNEKKEFVIPFRPNDSFGVGHGSCFGAYVYKLRRKYKVRFYMIDQCGNTKHQWTQWYYFDSPYVEKDF